MPGHTKPGALGLISPGFSLILNAQDVQHVQEVKEGRTYMSGLDQKQIDYLYQLLDRAEREKDVNSAAALRWAIYTLESTIL